MCKYLHEQRKTPLLLKILFILLFLVSISFNLALINNLEKKTHLYLTTINTKEPIINS